VTVPASKSTSDQRNPAISPRRNPDNARYVNESVDNEVAHVGVDQFSGIYPAVPPGTVATVVRGIHARFDGRPLRDYVPLLVERRARSELVKVLAPSGVCLPPRTEASV
jgi:hypothetical protein